jgi:hypothetical protein
VTETGGPDVCTASDRDTSTQSPLLIAKLITSELFG